MRCEWARALVTVALAIAGLWTSSFAYAATSPTQEVEFDEDQLKLLGIGTSVAEYFRHGARFSPGRQVVQVVINGASQGQVTAVFNAAGELCFTKEFTKSVGLVDIEESILLTLPDRSCPNYQAFSSRTVVVFKPSDVLIDLTVPTEKLAPVSNAETFQTGGIGGMVNYRFYGTQSRSNSATGTFNKYLDLSAGLNLEDWMVRSDQNLDFEGDVKRLSWNGLSVKKSFLQHGKVLKLGRISTQDLLFGGIPINGFTWTPESALRATNSHEVTGMALTRSTVEIRQNGVLLLRTFVPPGPFSLSDYPLRNIFNDLEVSVVSDTGSTQNFTVPATMLMQSFRASGVSGLHLSAGKLWSPASVTNRANPLIATASKSWIYQNLSGTNGLMISHGYMSTGTQMNFAIDEARNHSIFVHAITTHDLRSRAHGIATGGGLASRPSENFSAGASVNFRTGEYRGLPQSATRDAISTQKSLGTSVQSSFSANWSNPWIGAIGGSLTQEISALGATSRSIGLGWSASWKGVSLSLGLSHSVFRSKDGAFRPPGNTYFFASLNIPLIALGPVRNHLRYEGGNGQVGASYSADFLKLAQLSMSTDHNFGKSSGYSNSLSISTVPRYSAVSLGTTQSASYTSYYASASGSIIATKSGLALSPTDAQDSFGIAKTGDVTGVQLHTPGGTVWSGPFGLAAVPSYVPFRQSTVEVSTSSVGLDVQIDRGLIDVKASRGAVVNLDMGARRVRRVVLTVKDGNGSLLPTGSTITNEKGEMLTMSLARGKALVENLYDESVLYAETLDGQKCRFEQIVFLGKQGGQLFESGTAICVNISDGSKNRADSDPSE